MPETENMEYDEWMTTPVGDVGHLEESLLNEMYQEQLRQQLSDD